MSDTRPMEYHFSAVTTIDWTLDKEALHDLGDEIEQIINSWLENANIVENGAEISVNARQEMLKIITNFMCSDNFQWLEQ